MFVRINDDAKELGGGLGTWVEDYRGQIFEVEEVNDSQRPTAKWKVVGNSYVKGNGIAESQATVVNLRPPIKRFKDITIRSGMVMEYQKHNEKPVYVLFVASGDILESVALGIDCNDIYGLHSFPLYEDYIVRIYDAPKLGCSYVLNGNLVNYGDKVYERNGGKFSSSYGLVTVHEDGSVSLYGVKERRTKEEMKRIFKWGKTAKGGECLSEDSVLKIRCKWFTIKEIREFEKFYNDYLTNLKG